MTRIETEGEAERALVRDYESLGERLARRGVAIDADQGEGRRLRGRGPVLGRGDRRHALRALSRARRAARTSSTSSTTAPSSTG